jgi:cation transport regulator ChaB
MPANRARSTSSDPDIPRTILQSDRHAQRLWKAAHDSAVETYGEGASARRVAFAALKHQYQKQGDKWVKKAHKGPSDPQAARGPTTPRKSTDPDTAPTAGGKVAKTEAQAREKAREARREYARAYRARKKAAARKGTGTKAAGRKKKK